MYMNKIWAGKCCLLLPTDKQVLGNQKGDEFTCMYKIF